MKFLMLVILALTVRLAHATANERPVLIGGKARVVKTKIVSTKITDADGVTTDQDEIIATVVYNPICSPPTTFMIVNVANGKYEIYSAQPQPKAGELSCFAVGIATQDINLGPVPDTELEPLTINGEPVK
jgi:hypothetical protein